MSHQRLEQQLGFILEVDKLKRVLRHNLVTSQSRRENSAEHSWHLALAAIVFAEHAAAREVDISRVLRMVLVHDIVEIDAGDTYLYDTDAHITKAAREREAAERIFGLLPPEQGTEMRALWDEFETRQTPEARYAAAIDRLMPMLLNYVAEGVVWKKNGVTRTHIVERCAHMAEGAPALWDFAEAMLAEAVERGFLAE